VAGAALAARASAAGVPVHTVGRAFRRMQSARRVRRLLKQNRFDVVHANEAHALTAAWLARAHNAVPVVAARRVLFPLHRGMISLARYRAAARVIAVSRAVREELCAAGLDSTRIDVVPDGVEPAPPITAEERKLARARWGIAGDRQVAAYLAALTVEKGHDLLLDAFAELRRTVPSACLLLAGSGRLQEPLREKARAAGLLSEIRFAGFVEDTRPVYAACDVFVFPSRSEGFGSSLIGAMSCGLPVVALEGGATAEILEDGRNGLIAEPAAPLLAAATALLFRDHELAGRLGEAARETVRERYSVEHMVEATARLYERLAMKS
jgi:glycosyltransferase involved in cell wall biosynthesis